MYILCGTKCFCYKEKKSDNIDYITSQLKNNMNMYVLFETFQCRIKFKFIKETFWLTSYIIKSNVQYRT